MSRGTGNGNAVYFAPDDIARFRTRVAIGLIDFGVLFVAVVITHALVSSMEYASSWRAWSFLLGWLYLAALKSTRFGTLGYRILGFRLVGLDGKRPSLLQTTGRFLFVFLWGGIDTFWMLNDDLGQAFRDKFAGTYVIRRNAKPIGSTQIAYDDYFLFGASIRVPAVRHPKHG